MPNQLYSRWQYTIIKEGLAFRRVVILAGPRQCGKTTLAQEFVSPTTIYRTLDDRDMLESAIHNPKGFVHHNNELMIIDEIQRAPQLLSAIKQEVDVLKTPGRFLLTGSAKIQSLPGVTESLAGRVTKVRLRPLAHGELYNNPPHFLEVKSGSSLTKASFKNLQWFKKHMAKDKNFIGVVFYAGEQVLPFGEGLWAIPINVLWSEAP